MFAIRACSLASFVRALCRLPEPFFLAREAPRKTEQLFDNPIITLLFPGVNRRRAALATAPLGKLRLITVSLTSHLKGPL